MEEIIQFESEIKESSLLKMDAPKEQSSYIKVLGVGGAGTNAVNHMFRCGIQGVDFIVCNTDQVSLDTSPVANKIKIGEGGLGAGNTPERARIAAEEAEEEIKSYLEHNTRMLFVTAGMGGGTGTGASPVVARFAKEIKLESTDEQILVIGVVTLPFSFEGRKRKTQAQEGIKKLKSEVDAVITINTDKLKEYGNFTMSRAFAMADDILLTAAKGISEMMTDRGYVHVDFRDVQNVMQNSGVALMGTGVAEGENRAIEAIQLATTSKLLNDNDITATKNVLLYFLSSSENEIRMEEIETITTYLEQATNEDVDCIWGMGIDDTLGDKLSITLVATGFNSQEIYEPPTRTTTPLPPIPIPESITKKEETNQEPYIKAPEQDIAKNESEKETLKENDDCVKENKEDVIVIKVGEDMKPINSTPTQDATTTEPKFTGIISTSGITVMPTPSIKEEEKQPIAQTPISSEPQINQVFPPIDTNPEVTFEERMERMRLIREMLSTDAGIDQLIATPALEIEVKNFSQANEHSNYSVNKLGQVVYSKNTALDTCVD